MPALIVEVSATKQQAKGLLTVMIGYVMTLVVAVLFIFFERIFIGINKISLFAYFVIIELLIAFLLRYYFLNNDIEVYTIATLQTAFLIYIVFEKNYLAKHKKIYLLFWSSNINVLFVSGLRKLESSERTLVEDEASMLLCDNKKLNKRCLLFLSYNKKILSFKFAFFDKSDFYNFINEKEIVEENISESKIVGNGYSFVYNSKIS